MRKKHTPMRSFAFTQQSTQVLPTPMFYSHADFPSGQHPWQRLFQLRRQICRVDGP